MCSTGRLFGVLVLNDWLVDWVACSFCVVLDSSLFEMRGGRFAGMIVA